MIFSWFILQMHFSDEMLSLKSLTNCISLQTVIFEICTVSQLIFRGKPTLHYLHWNRKRLVSKRLKPRFLFYQLSKLGNRCAEMRIVFQISKTPLPFALKPFTMFQTLLIVSRAGKS